MKDVLELGEKNDQADDSQNPEEIKKREKKKSEEEYLKQLIELEQKIMEDNEDKPFWSTGIIGKFFSLIIIIMILI